MKKSAFIAFSLLCMLLLVGIAIAEPMVTMAEPMVTIAEPVATSGVSVAALATPVLVSPANGVILTHFPRNTTLTWQPVTGATSYKVERAYYSGSTWIYYPVVTVTGYYNASFTFSFVGDQRGAWRVTALGTSDTSAASTWWYFTYSTKPALSTPGALRPTNNSHLIGFPRTTKLEWNPVPGATGYQIDRAYYDGTWHAYTVVTLNGVQNTAYTFDFVGDQLGCWSVTALGSAAFANSAPSNRKLFDWKSGVKLATPVMLRPTNGTSLIGFPRTTTLAWNPVPGATGYQIERAYYDGTWHAYTVVTCPGVQNTSYTFNFVGDQPGRWRVTALGSAPFANSNPSAWWIFSWSSASRVSTPVQVSPVDNIQFYHYPRTTTVTWKPVAGAAGYQVETQYLETTWKAYVTGTPTSPSYTFNFVGAQPGRWRVTATGTTVPFADSYASNWRNFTYHV